jgi:hypothetical protein
VVSGAFLHNKKGIMGKIRNSRIVKSLPTMGV